MGGWRGGNFDDVDSNVKAENVLTITTTPQEAKAGATALEGRQTLRLYNKGPQKIYWGYTNAVTDVTGEPIHKGQGITLMYGPDISIYLVTATSTADVLVRESG